MEIDKYIEQAESILLNGETFDDERKDFIKNLETCDLLAVPGSGKTTALLAKLYCIAQNMPFEAGEGILVLSHTNHAIEEIEKKLKGYCPKLFQYPNYIGTVQSFVNKFLTIPFYENKNSKRIISIDDEYHNYHLNKIILETFIANNNLKRIYNTPKIPWKYNFELSEVTNQIIDLATKNRIVITKPRGNAKNYTDWSNAEKNIVEKKLYDVKLKLLREGILNFNDSYFFAKVYIRKTPVIKSILQSRFKYVFIDEMQDLENNQIQLIDDIFFNNSSNTIIQRIGDKNQAIYNSGKKVKEQCDWQTREEENRERHTDLSLQNSMRLSNKTAMIVDKLILTRPENYNVIGKFDEVDIPPHLILIDHNTGGETLKIKFQEIIKQYNLHSETKNLEKGFHIISWTTEKENDNALCLKKLFPDFSKESRQKKDNFDCLRKYLFLYDEEKLTLEAIRKSILNALVRVLHLESIKTLEGKNYTKRHLINFFKKEGEEFYNTFNSKLFRWCFEIVCGKKYDDIYIEIKTYIHSDSFIGLNWKGEEQFTAKTILHSRDFINKDYVNTIIEIQENQQANTEEFPINLSSVHAVKGQTHCATMYVESAYQRPTYETQKIIKKDSNPLLLQEHRCNGVYDKQALKMMYVGFSRPTHLLCFAVLKENIEEHIESLQIENGGMWHVIDDLVAN